MCRCPGAVVLWCHGVVDVTWSLVVSRSNWCRRLISCTQAMLALAIAGVFKLCMHSWQASFPLLLLFSEMRLSQGQLQQAGFKLKCTGAIIVCGNKRNEQVAAVVESRCDIRPEPEARCNCPTSTSLVLHSSTYQSSVTPPQAPVWAYNLPGMISPCKDQQFGRDRPSLNTRGIMKPSIPNNSQETFWHAS